MFLFLSSFCEKNRNISDGGKPRGVPCAGNISLLAQSYPEWPLPIYMLKYFDGGLYRCKVNGVRTSWHYWYNWHIKMDPDISLGPVSVGDGYLLSLPYTLQGSGCCGCSCLPPWPFLISLSPICISLLRRPPHPKDSPTPMTAHRQQKSIPQ